MTTLLRASRLQNSVGAAGILPHNRGYPFFGLYNLTVISLELWISIFSQVVLPRIHRLLLDVGRD